MRDDDGLRDELLKIERGFWTGDGDYYRRWVDDECLTVFTGMAGVMSAEQIAGTVEPGERWADPEIEVKGMVTPADGVAILTYEARTAKAGSAYHALVSSGYVRRDGGWRMTFHQQSPMALDESDAAAAGAGGDADASEAGGTG